MPAPFRRFVARLAAGSVTVALGACAVAAPASAATPGCSLTATAGTVTRTLGTRTYELHVPPGLTGTQVPLLLSLHGAGSNGFEDEFSTGWSVFAGAHNFIVAYPDAQGSASGVWNPYTQGSPDVTFARAVLADISARWCVDPHHVHVDGWSNGAVMSQRVACDAADAFASVTSYGGGTPTLSGTGAAPCRPSRPISVGLFVGQLDFTFAGLSQDTNEWLGYDRCSTTPVHTVDAYGTLDSYSCAAGTQVLARVVSNTSHNWPSGAQGEDQRTRMWAFFQANPLP
jgi:polyhydroxybutyrate depolymerase